jgi:predicted dehydrogenase
MGAQRAKQLTETPGAKLVRVVDVNADRAKEIGERHSCRWSASTKEAFKDDDIEVVQVMTPTGLHAEIAVEALEAGKHVIVTKPLEVSLERCDMILAAAKKTGRKLGVDFQERYTAENQKIKRAVSEGLFGKLLLGEARLKWFRDQAYYDRGGWRGTWRMDGGGALANQTIHVIDLLCWIMGRPTKIIGRTYQLNHTIETEDVGMAMLEFASGAVGTILGTTTCPASTYWGLEIHGSEGRVNAPMGSPYDWRFLEGLTARQEQLRTLYPYRNVFEDVVSALRRETPLACSGEEGRATVEVLTAIYESARNGGAPVTLPPTTT